tara:strand:- start:4196 stop:4696 length:501 start_codon:yes stop_codon:yes gene_type:complete
MHQIQYFTRHGKCADDHITPNGIAELKQVRNKLDETGFIPKTVLSSTANRCIETAKVLAPDCPIKTSEELLAFADYRYFVENEGHTPEDAPEKWNFSNWETALNLVLSEKPSLIVGHDSNSVILAFKLLETQGVAIDWHNQPDIFQNLDMGCGVLVVDNTFLHLHP